MTSQTVDQLSNINILMSWISKTKPSCGSNYGRKRLRHISRKVYGPICVRETRFRRRGNGAALFCCGESYCSCNLRVLGLQVMRPAAFRHKNSAQLARARCETGYALKVSEKLLHEERSLSEE